MAYDSLFAMAIQITTQKKQATVQVRRNVYKTL